MKHPVLTLLMVLSISSSVVASPTQESPDLQSPDEFPPLKATQKDETRSLPSDQGDKKEVEEVRLTLIEINAYRESHEEPLIYIRIETPSHYLSNGTLIQGAVHWIKSPQETNPLSQAINEDSTKPNMPISSQDLTKTKNNLQSFSTASFEIETMRALERISRVKDATEYESTLDTQKKTEAQTLYKLKNKIRDLKRSQTTKMREQFELAKRKGQETLDKSHEMQDHEFEYLHSQNYIDVFDADCKKVIENLDPDFYSMISKTCRRASQLLN